MAQTIDTAAPVVTAAAAAERRGRRKSYYPYWFLVPGGLIFAVFFLVPSVIAFYFSLTRWTLFDQEFIGLDNFRQFFAEPALISGLTHTLFYAVVTSGLKVVLGMALALLLTGPIIGRTFLRSVASSRCWSAPSGSASPSGAACTRPRARSTRRSSVVGIAGPAGWSTRSGRCSPSPSSTSGRASGWPP